MVDRSDDAAINRLRFRPRFFSFFFLFFYVPKEIIRDNVTHIICTARLLCAVCCMNIGLKVSGHIPGIYISNKKVLIFNKIMCIPLSLPSHIILLARTTAAAVWTPAAGKAVACIGHSVRYDTHTLVPGTK